MPQDFDSPTGGSAERRLQQPQSIVLKRPAIDVSVYVSGPYQLCLVINEGGLPATRSLLPLPILDYSVGRSVIDFNSNDPEPAYDVAAQATDPTDWSINPDASASWPQSSLAHASATQSAGVPRSSFRASASISASLMATAAVTLGLALPALAQQFPYGGGLDDLEHWYHQRVRRSLIRRDEEARRVAREWQAYLDRLQQEREAQEARAQQWRDEQRQLQEAREERVRHEEAERQAQREAEARRIAESQAEQRALARDRQARRAAEWQRWKADVSEWAAPILSVLLTLTLWLALPLTLFVLALSWASTIAHRSRLHRVNREIERARVSTRHFEDLTADLKRAKAEADAFIAREARIAYQRGRGL